MPLDITRPGHAEGAQRVLGRAGHCLGIGQFLGGGKVSQAPQPSQAVPARDHDVTLLPQDVEHPLHVPAVRPAGGDPADGRAVLDRLAGQRSGGGQQVQHVAAELVVRG